MPPGTPLCTWEPNPRPIASRYSTGRPTLEKTVAFQLRRYQVHIVANTSSAPRNEPTGRPVDRGGVRAGAVGLSTSVMVSPPGFVRSAGGTRPPECCGGPGWTAAAHRRGEPD